MVDKKGLETTVHDYYIEGQLTPQRVRLSTDALSTASQPCVEPVASPSYGAPGVFYLEGDKRFLDRYTELQQKTGQARVELSADGLTMIDVPSSRRAAHPPYRTPETFTEHSAGGGSGPGFLMPEDRKDLPYEG